EIELNYKEVGRIFKKDLKLVEERLKEMDIEEMERMVEELKEKGKYILRVEKDGEVKEFEILESYVKVKKVVKKIRGEKILPHVIEPSYGIDRILYCLLEHSYREEEDRVYLDLKPKVAPVKVGVFPLVNRDRLPEIAKSIKEILRKEGIVAQYDDRGAIGRRYMRMDEIGTPFCITVDGQTLEDGTVTVRYRNSREQERVKIEEVVDYIKSKL
ncbi:glycine--tRNA ligase, partial [Methanothermococcus sp. SCGC AD-155-N22]|nr:glycine--tRNA ligase [Methanothermococcus sp. SCGC AD-155-N22]